MAVFTSNSEKADFLLPKGKGKKGMIIEIKAENKGHGGTGLLNVVKEGLKKMESINTEHQDDTHVSIALAFTAKTQDQLRILEF